MTSSTNGSVRPHPRQQRDREVILDGLKWLDEC